MLIFFACNSEALDLALPVHSIRHCSLARLAMLRATYKRSLSSKYRRDGVYTHRQEFRQLNHSLSPAYVTL